MLRAVVAPRIECSSPHSLPCGLAARSCSHGTEPITECQPWEAAAAEGGVDGSAGGAPALAACPAADLETISKSRSLELEPLATASVPKRCTRAERGVAAAAACCACAAGGPSLACMTRPMGEEATLLAEELARLKRAGGEATAEFAEVLKLIDGLKPLLPPERLAELEVAAGAPPSPVARAFSGHI